MREFPLAYFSVWRIRMWFRRGLRYVSVETEISLN